MKKFIVLSTQGKLLIGFGLILLMMVLLVVINYIGTSSIVQRQTILFRKNFPEVINLLKLRSDQNRTRALMLEMMLMKNPQKHLELEQDINSRVKEIDDSIKELYELNRENPAIRDNLTELQSQISTYRQVRSQQIDMIRQGRMQEALAMGSGIQAQRYDSIRALAKKMGDNAHEEARILTDKSLQAAKFTLMADIILGIIATFSVVVIFLLIILSLRRIVGNITEGINILGSSAREIVTTITQVASSATETAMAVTQTTATVEEVRQTAQISSQKARTVQETAQKVSQSAQSGKQSVVDTVDGMGRIHRQMSSIADIIVKLSEQSQAISEITSSVNDLADQSNLLAVNAAIEAVKAGEQGLGFSVVAQEIKSLAEQSKQATAQVRNILNDIQKAVNQAVMSAEQGTKAVEAGRTLAEQSGEAIRQLAESINETAQAATQIAASSQQQMVGMDQIAPAMESIKQAMAQNTASIDQSQRAAQNLHDLGQNLKQLVEKFQV